MESFDPLDYVDEWHEAPVRAEADPIEAEETLDSFEPLDTKCASVANTAVRRYVGQSFDDPGRVGGGIGNIDHPDYETAVFVHRHFIVNRDGSVASRPKVAYDRLLQVTPKAVHATVRFENQTHTCEYPVFLEDEVWYVE